MKKETGKPTREALVADIKRLFKTNGGKPISRDYFRTNSKFKSKWSTCFSTFAEFMLAAGLPVAVARRQRDPQPVTASPEVDAGLLAWLKIPKMTLEHRHHLVICGLAKKIRNLEAAVKQLRYGTHSPWVNI
jgi:hypothetical protein